MKLKSKINSKNAICGICPAGCWVTVAYDEKGMINEVRPDESSHLGMICKLGEYSSEIVYSKDRLRYPMRRKGPKGTYEFERISWDSAYNIIVENLNTIKEESGPEATAIYTGRGSFELAMCDIFQPKGVAVSSGIKCSVSIRVTEYSGRGSTLLCFVCHDCSSYHYGGDAD